MAEKSKCGFLTPIVELKGKAGITFKVEKCGYEYADKEDYAEHMQEKHRIIVR
jgi:hypothetical protein